MEMKSQEVDGKQEEQNLEEDKQDDLIELFEEATNIDEPYSVFHLSNTEISKSEIDNLLNDIQNMNISKEPSSLNLMNEMFSFFRESLEERKEMIEDLVEILEQELNEMDKSELIQLCKELNLPYSGNMSILKERIINYHKKDLEWDPPEDNFQFKSREKKLCSIWTYWST